MFLNKVVGHSFSRYRRKLCSLAKMIWISKISKCFKVQVEEKTEVSYIYEFRHNNVLSLNQIFWR
ncbi:hypothetical protein FF021_20935 [Leptospira noguchii]|nr:hypothetical protein FF021_20935 [Leptospira noguchii]